jgi:hypothetical protein
MSIFDSRMLSSIHPAVTGIAEVRRIVQVIYTDDVRGLLSCGRYTSPGLNNPPLEPPLDHRPLHRSAARGPSAPCSKYFAEKSLILKNQRQPVSSAMHDFNSDGVRASDRR